MKKSVGTSTRIPNEETRGTGDRVENNEPRQAFLEEEQPDPWDDRDDHRCRNPLGTVLV